MSSSRRPRNTLREEGIERGGWVDILKVWKKGSEVRNEGGMRIKDEERTTGMYRVPSTYLGR